VTLGEYFKTRHFAPRLLTDYLAPMGSAIWSAPSAQMMDFPAENFVAFFSNHRLLQYDRPVWRSVKGGSQRYFEKMISAFRDQIRLGCAVTSIERTPHGVVVHDDHGRHDSYDHVVIAAHSDQALAMLSDADPRERAVLGAICYSPNTIYLHRDVRLMPKRKRAWASWNFLRWQRENSAHNDVAVTYWMNPLQRIDDDKPLFVSRNPPFEPAPQLTFGKYSCEHPQYSAAAFAAQKQLGDIQEKDHGERDGSSLRIYAQCRAAECGVDLTGGRVLLLCYPRLLGFTFNPLSAYFCHRADGELALMMYEVRNTFGDIHVYVLAVKPGELSEAGLRQQQDKLFYVSPFIDMPMRYHFRISPPAADIKLRILETDSAGPLLAATFHGRRHELSTAQLLRSFLALPFVTLKILAAIHWEALRLWIKGARLVPCGMSATGHTALHSASNTVLASSKSPDYTAPESYARGGALWSGDGGC
jgi:DUF1365 family protein